MLYATDLCNSKCKHCLVWTKKPVRHLPFEVIKQVVKSKAVHKQTVIGLEGGEFLLHPQADEIMSFLDKEHPKYDLLSNCVQPHRTIQAIEKHKPVRLFVSLDGTPETHQYMRGKDCYNEVIEVIQATKHKVPVSVMFTLTPYNSFDDLTHVCKVSKEMGIDVRIGIYNNMPYFETIEQAHTIQNSDTENIPDIQSHCFVNKIPDIVKEFDENYDFIALYDSWKKGLLSLSCNSILDSIIILPDGKVPICQNLSLELGNVNEESLYDIINKRDTILKQKYHQHNCNKCWINFHRKYDIILYRTAEKLGGRFFTQLLLGKYHWNSNHSTISYKKYLKNL
jgi:MoaA/NifB/PqqE/SkfB family radical SAM enzyme